MRDAGVHIDIVDVIAGIVDVIVEVAGSNVSRSKIRRPRKRESAGGSGLHVCAADVRTGAGASNADRSGVRSEHVANFIDSAGAKVWLSDH